jgi:hypothetical protein
MVMRVVSLGFAMLASGRDVTGSGSCIYDNGYYRTKSHRGFSYNYFQNFKSRYCCNVYNGLP